MKKLTPKQEIFVREYLIDLNATQACIRAGYTPTNADKFGHELLGKPLVREAIEKAKNKRAHRTELSQDRVLMEIARLAFIDPRQAFNKDTGTLKNVHEWPDEVAAAISSIKVNEVKDAEGNVTVQVKEVKFWDKNSAADKLMKHLGAYEIDNKQKSPLQDLSRDTLQLIREKLANGKS